MAVVLGLDAKMYRNTGTYGSPTWTEMTNVRDVTFNLDKGEANVTTRGSKWELVKFTLKKAGVDFEMIWDTSDSSFAAILAAWLADTDMEFLILDGPVGTAGSQGLRATMSIKSVSRSEPLEDALKASVSLRPTYASNAPSWFTAP